VITVAYHIEKYYLKTTAIQSRGSCIAVQKWGAFHRTERPSGLQTVIALGTLNSPVLRCQQDDGRRRSNRFSDEYVLDADIILLP
jgi:hypothetical protein